MGCDIHALYERREYDSYEMRPSTYLGWVCKGDPEIDRWYALFGVLAGVRDVDATPIAEPRGMPGRPSVFWEAYCAEEGGDLHTHSWLTLGDLKRYEGEVDEAVKGELERIALDLDQLKRSNYTDEDVRIVFAFDN